MDFLDGLSDDALKKEATTEARSDTFSSIMKVADKGRGGKEGREKGGGIGRAEEGRRGREGEERGGMGRGEESRGGEGSCRFGV